MTRHSTYTRTLTPVDLDLCRRLDAAGILPLVLARREAERPGPRPGWWELLADLSGREARREGRAMPDRDEGRDSPPRRVRALLWLLGGTAGVVAMAGAVWGMQ